jgi:tetratricopeptide (TPR) repeat protein
VLLEIRQTMDDLNNSWRDNDALAARGELLQATALQRAGKTADAAQMAKNAAERLANMEDFFAADTALQVAAQLRALGQEAQADQVLSSCAEIYGDDPKVMAGIAEQTSDPNILRGGDQAMELNRQGMQLYQGKQFPQALEAFRNALALQPRNISYALNTAQSLLRLLLSAPDPALREECLDCLQRVRNMPPGDPRFERYNKLREKAESL